MNSLDKFCIASITFLVFMAVALALYASYVSDKATTLQNQVNMLVQESEQLHKRFDAESKKAHEEVIKVNQNSKLILAVDMPKNCDAAVRWGIEQGGKF